ncbi:serine hydrolase [Streptomyces sp. NPDC087270]|uniref:serine hydrolase n=1 Tax=Streptomyces sp. NPDC087270 TaxID=3365774 RepID=UPI0037F35B78
MEEHRPLADREGGGWAAMAGTHDDGTGAAPGEPVAKEGADRSDAPESTGTLDAGAEDADPAEIPDTPGAPAAPDAPKAPGAPTTPTTPEQTAPDQPEPESDPSPARPWVRPLLISVTALAVMAVLTLATIVQSPSAKAGSDTSPTADTTVPTATTTTSATQSTPRATATATTTSSATATAAKTTTSPDAAVTTAVRTLGVSGHVSVAVTDADGGAAATYETGAASYDTASIVKVDILATLLLQDQHAGTRLTAAQRTLATAMIERSDNDAALDLWRTIGRSAGLAAANKTFGLDDTVGGEGDLWGLTQTTASDQIALLHAVFDSDSPLSASSRAYVSGLMRSVIDGERWGVSAADSDDSGYALKNGWLQRSATGLWDINSIGEVTYDGHRLLVSVLSSGQKSEQGGIDQVERVARAAAQAYVDAA